ncbi:leucine--tRNA ligase [Candidatus Micrarchaeota archaeon]|nr:leucine--tRNA ligase [Candidatus Micrarchaeota archaeon]
MDWDYTSIEKKWQDKWFESKAFEPKTDSSKKKFFFTIPYPYVSGTLHVGHGRTYTNGDVIARYKRMAGFNVLFPMAFHITGTPVLAISNKIKAGDAQTIALYKDYVGVYEKDEKKISGIVHSFTDPWAVVNYFSGKLINDFKSVGYSIDLSRQFTTGDAEYNKFIEWQFRKFKEKNYLKQADYPLLYCITDKNAVAEDDIKDGDTDSVEVQKFIAFKFAREDGSFIVSSTLRPETVFGITNMFVNPETGYELVEVDGEKLWLSAQAAEKLSYQNRKVKKLGEKKGGEFVGEIITGPLGNKIPILPAGFVDADNATGFVHSVPAHAPFDAVAIEELKKNKKELDRYKDKKLEEKVNAIKLISLISVPDFGEFPALELVQQMKIVNTRERQKLEKATKELYSKEFYGGKLKKNCGQFAGLSVADAKTRVGDELKAGGKAFDFFETNRAAECRCGGKVIAAIMSGQWFIDYNSAGWKEKSFECLKEMKVYPEKYRKQFEDIFNWLDKRPCARRRGLGTQLPFNNEWIIESLSDSTIYMSFYAIIKEIRANKIKPEQLTEEFFDFVYLGRGDVQVVAKKTLVKEDVLEKTREEFLYWYPLDHRHTAIAHISNHLSFFVFAHTAIFEKRHWPKAITLNDLLICEGKKMSKSKGNVILLNSISKTVGSDLFRLYCAHASDFGSVLDYRAKDAEAARKTFLKYVGAVRELSAALKSKAQDGKGEETSLSNWFVSKFESTLRDSTLALEEFRLRDYIQASFFDLLNAYDYFTKRASEGEKAFVAKKVLNKWALLLCPVTPHASEELWSEIGGKTIASLSQWPKFDSKAIDGKLEEEQSLVQSVLFDCRKIIELVKFKPKRAAIFVASKSKFEQVKKAVAGADEQSKVKSSDEAVRKFVEKNFFQLKRGLSSIDERKVLGEAKEFLEKELNLVIEIREETPGEQKSLKAMPLKPAVVLEYNVFNPREPIFLVWRNQGI